jgi:small-conductance mechanosensitive channel
MSANQKDIEEMCKGLHGLNFCASPVTFSIFVLRKMTEPNALSDAVNFLEKKVCELLERLSFQREENLRLKRELVELEQSKMILEEQIGVLNSRLAEAQVNFSKMGSVQQDDVIEQRLDEIIRELQECIDEIN